MMVEGCTGSTGTVKLTEVRWVGRLQSHPIHFSFLLEAPITTPGHLPDIRWKQRLKNFSLALEQLAEAVAMSKQRELSKLEKQGLIQAFESTHELAWNVLKDYFDYQSGAQITGSRDANREAFKFGLITDGDGWMEMIKSRNQTSYTYNRATADDIAKKTCDLYWPLFEDLKKKMLSLA